MEVGQILGAHDPLDEIDRENISDNSTPSDENSFLFSGNEFQDK